MTTNVPARRMGRLCAALLAATLCWASLEAAADPAPPKFPEKPVTIVVPYSAGGFTDILARLLARSLGDKWHVPVIVENRVGAGGNIGAAYVARSAPDGHTLLVANTATNAINEFLYRDPGFAPDKDFVAVALLAKTPNVMVVPAAGPKTVAAFIDQARQTKAGVFYGSAGNGTTSHLTGALFAGAAGLSAMTHVPFRGSSEVMTALQSGTVQLAFDNIAAWAPLVRSGRVRALAVTGAERSALLPDVPTLAQAGVPNVESYSWFGLAAPAGLGAAVIEKINRDVNDVIADPDFAAKLPGARIAPETPAAFGAFIEAERSKWGRIIKASKLDPS